MILIEERATQEGESNDRKDVNNDDSEGSNPKQRDTIFGNRLKNTEQDIVANNNMKKMEAEGVALRVDSQDGHEQEENMINICESDGGDQVDDKPARSGKNGSTGSGKEGGG